MSERFFGGSWAATTWTNIEQNEELHLDSRILIIAGAEYHLIRNQSMELSAGLGGAFNGETFTGEERASSAEIAVVTTFDAFDIGDLNFRTSATTFIAPADGGRFRLNVDGRISWEIFNDFVIGITVTERYDTEPPSADAGRDFHYGVTLGWSWG